MEDHKGRLGSARLIMSIPAWGIGNDYTVEENEPEALKIGSEEKMDTCLY
jgi:hypothetical protein